MTQMITKSAKEGDDELVCRRLVSGLHISSKIAFAFGAEDYEWFLEWLPLAKKYCLECAFWTDLMHSKKCIKHRQAKKITNDLKRIVKKIDAIIRYLERFGNEEKYTRKVFFASRNG